MIREQSQGLLYLGDDAIVELGEGYGSNPKGPGDGPKNAAEVGRGQTVVARLI